MIKPRIRLILKVWSCYAPGNRRMPVGVGYTPRAAYDDWLRQFVQAGGVL